jgi:hypothetical protein
MESSKNSLDKFVRFKYKLQKFAMISVFFTGTLTLGLLMTNYRLSNLNKNKVNELIQYQNKIKIDAQVSLDIKERLDEAISEITKLKKQLKAEKSVANSLKEKLTNTLNLLAQTAEKPVIEQKDIQQRTAVSDIIPTESNHSGKVQQALENSDMSTLSLKKVKPSESGENDQELKNSTDINTDKQEDISLSTQLSSSERSSKKENISASSHKAEANAITSKTVESSQLDKQTDISPSKPQEEDRIQPLNSVSETPVKNNSSNDVSLGDSDLSSELSPPKQEFIDQQH